MAYLPREIGSLQHLNRLKLDFNQFLILPNEIERLANLRIYIPQIDSRILQAGKILSRPFILADYPLGTIGYNAFKGSYSTLKSLYNKYIENEMADFYEQMDSVTDGENLQTYQPFSAENIHNRDQRNKLNNAVERIIAAFRTLSSIPSLLY